MPFPEVPRVLYNNNPLDQVICQLRFPPILRIDAELPAIFQEKIRKEFPNFAESAEVNMQIRPNLAGQIQPEMLRQILQPTSNKNYEFSSEDGVWTINLTRTFLALSTTKYNRWEEFIEKFKLPLTALIDIYSPDSFSRVGLRYVDVICRSKLGLDATPWSELLQPYVAGILGAPGISESVISHEGVYELRLADGESIVRIATRMVQSVDDEEICYMIDNDFSDTRKMTVEQATQKLDYFHTRASRLIQWSITPRLHEAMEPMPL